MHNAAKELEAALVNNVDPHPALGDFVTAFAETMKVIEGAVLTT